MRKTVLFLLTLLLFSRLISQTTDSSALRHSPKKAVLMSAILPGLGQAYNKKYWKIPVIYAAGGYLVYNVVNNQGFYENFKEGFRLLSDTSQRISEVIIGGISYSALQCKTNRDLFRRQRDLNIFATLLVYTLNLIDANVDAHLFDFDMGDNLSARWQPALMGSGSVGVSLKLSLK